MSNESPEAEFARGRIVGIRMDADARRFRHVVLILVFSLVLLTALSCLNGSVNLDIRDLIDTDSASDRSIARIIVLDLRLPSALGAILAGFALGVSGLQLQTYFRNPLAGPFVLGIDSGASLWL